MPHEVLVTPQALRDIGGLPERLRPPVLETIHGSIAENPERVGKRLKLELDGLYTARRGEFRVVFRIDRRPRQVVVLRVGHRRDVYR